MVRFLRPRRTTAARALLGAVLALTGPPAVRAGAPRAAAAGPAVAAVSASSSRPAPQASAGGPASRAEGPNLVANGDFSGTTGGAPRGWAAAGDRFVEQRLETARDAGGNPYARLVCTRFEKRTPASHAMLAQTGVVALVRGRTYAFSCRVRGEGLRGGAVSVAVTDTHTWTDGGLRASLAVGRRWRTFRRVFTASRTIPASASRLQIWFAETGTLCVDDVRLVEVRLGEVAFTDVVSPADGRNLVHNGSFEAGADGWTSEGHRVGWGNLSGLHGRVETGEAPHGRRFLRIPLGGEATPVLAFDYYEATVRRELAPLAVSRGWLRVEPGRPYTLSAWMRASRPGVPARLGARNRRPLDGRQDYGRRLTLTTRWTRYTLTFRPVHPYVFVYAGPDLDEEATVWVDLDAVRLEAGETATAFGPRRTVEMGLEPSAPGGLFAEGEPAYLTARLANQGKSAARCRLRLEATDYFDAPAPWTTFEAEVGPGRVLERRLAVPAQWKGYYRVRARLEGGGPPETRTLRLAVLPRRREADSFLGINHAFATDDLVRQAVRGGVGWFRDWSLKWQHIEPRRGEFHWDRADAQIDRVVRLGAQVVCLLPPFPSADWVSEAPPTLPKRGYPAVRLPAAWAPKDPAELARFVGQAVARYRDRVKVWEFLNEPIFTDYALPGDAGHRYDGPNYTPADYVRLLAVAARAMKRADPACRVIGGIASGPLHLTREVIEAGALRHIDILNLHMYPGSRRPEAYADEMDRLLALMDAAGRRVPVWVTEFAYYGADDLPRRPFTPRPGSWSEARLLESERACGDLTVRFVLLMLSRGVEKVFLHSGASGTVHEPNFECPLFAYGGTPRKALAALAVAVHLLGPRPEFVGERRLGEAAWALAFRARGRSVVALWSPEGEAEAHLAPAAPADLTYLDAMGRPMPPTGRWRLSASPIYLVGPPEAAGRVLAALRAEEP